MKRKVLTWLLAASSGLVTATQFSPVNADEIRGALYEDDAWYDVTEWFDGNDYNPTDERFFHWDDETYQASNTRNSADRDNDGNLFGYTNSATTGSTANEDWYYDYDYSNYSSYDDSDTNGLYEMSSRYYDYDNDGYYDAYASYLDSDGDGLYEDYAYLSFADSPNSESQAANAKKDAASSSSHRSGKMFTVEGQIASTKQVQGRNGKHLVIQVTQIDRKFAVDLGMADRLQMELSKGDKVTARGPVTTVGDKQVLLAKEVEHDGKSTEINRSPRTLAGTVMESMKAKLRKNGAEEHLLVKLKTEDGKQALIDMGSAAKLNVNFDQGEKMEASGVAVKLKDRPVLFASSATVGGQQIKIDRRGN